MEQENENTGGEMQESQAEGLPAEQLFDIGLSNDSTTSNEEQYTEVDQTPEPVKESVRQPEARTEPTTEKKAEPEPAKEPEDDMLALRQQLAQMSAELSALKEAGSTTAQATKEPELQLPTNPAEITSVDFLQGEDPADLLAEPERLNALLNKVATTAARAAVASASEVTIRRIPEIVQRSVAEQSQTQQVVDTFYSQNQDLTPFKPAMAAAARQVFAEDPHQSLADVLTKSGQKVREMLRLRQTQVGVNPAQPVSKSGAGTSRASASKISDVNAEIARMLNL